MNDVITNLIAGLIASAVLAVVGFAFKQYYPRIIRMLTNRLLDNALRIPISSTDESKKAFKRTVIERVQQEVPEKEQTMRLLEKALKGKVGTTLDDKQQVKQDVIARVQQELSEGEEALRLLNKALNGELKATTEEVQGFRKQIVERIQQEHPIMIETQQEMVTHFDNQDECLSLIRDACSMAKTIKILTIRGERYFLGSMSLLTNICLQKRGKGDSIDVLVLSPDAQHIAKVTKDRTSLLGQRSAEQVKKKMQTALRYMQEHIAPENSNFRVHIYDETPVFKILLFDDTMFVSAFTTSKNDQNESMWQLTRKDNPVFAGLEKYFDELLHRSVQ